MNHSIITTATACVSLGEKPGLTH